MIRVISGIRVGPTQSNAFVTRPENRLQFLQFKDVFFSNQSVKAVLERFTKQPEKPLPRPMVLYFGSDAEQYKMLNRVFPAEKVAITAIPFAG
jgi:hypothetical protein